MNYKKLLFPLFCSCLAPFAYADLSERMLQRLDRDYVRIDQLEKAANPKAKSLEDLVAEKNSAFLEKIKSRVSENEMKAVAQEITQVKVVNAINIEKDYFDKLESTENFELSDDKNQLLEDLLISSDAKMQKDVNFGQLAKISTEKINPEIESLPKNEMGTRPKTFSGAESKFKSSRPPGKMSEEEIALKKTQSDALVFSKMSKNKFQPTERDSIFKKISKAYNRNLERIIDTGEENK